MTSIADFPDHPKFTVKNVSIQTGIHPVTLRAWERRYKVLSPHRSGNRYRLYSERDIAILRWLKSRINSGMSISAAVVELHKMVDSGVWPEAVPIGMPLKPGKSTIAPEKYAQELYRVLIRHEEASANSLIREILAGFDVKTITLEILIPCLVEIGEAWARGDIRVITEHFASAFLRGKLLALLHSYPARRGAPSIMVGGAPTEEHEIGPLMMALLLRGEGYDVEFLGTDLPLDDLVEYARFEKPAMIILSATTHPAALEIMTMQKKLARLRSVPIFGYGGRAFNIHPELRRQIPGVFLGETLDIALKTVADLLKSSSTGKLPASKSPNPVVHQLPAKKKHRAKPV